MANRQSGTSLKDVVDFCHNSDSCSDHSSIGGLSSDEEDYIDDLLLKWFIIKQRYDRLKGGWNCCQVIT